MDLPDEATPFGKRVRRRLREEQIVWLTTTGDDGTPQPNPVWFVWEEPDGLLIYNRSNARRLEHLAPRPRVSAHFDGDGRGGDIVVFAGVAEQALEVPEPDFHKEYVAKYGA